MTKTYLEFQDDKSHKFWQIDLEDKSFTVTFGKVDTAGQSKVKKYSTPEEAEKEAAKLIRQKTNKGYVPKDKEVAAKTPTKAAPKDSASAEAADYLAQFFHALQQGDKDGEFYYYTDWAGCTLLGYGADDFAVSGKDDVIADGDAVLYDSRGHSGTYILLDDDASIHKVTLSNPEKYNIDASQPEVARLVSSPSLLARYRWIVHYTQRFDYLAPFGNDHYPEWQNITDVQAAFEAEKAEFANDPHLALYWMFHFLLTSDPRFSEVSDIATKQGFDEKDARFKMLLAASKAKAKDKKKIHRPTTQSVLMCDSYSKAHAAGAEGLEYWWQSIALCPENYARILTRIFWFEQNLSKYDKWDEFAVLVTKRRSKKPIALFSYLEALKPNNPKAGDDADQAVLELDNEAKEVREICNTHPVAFAEYMYYGLLMLWRLKDHVQDKTKYQEVANRYYKSSRDEDASALTPPYLEIMASLGEDPQAISTAIHNSRQLKQLCLNHIKAGIDKPALTQAVYDFLRILPDGQQALDLCPWIPSNWHEDDYGWVYLDSMVFSFLFPQHHMPERKEPLKALFLRLDNYKFHQYFDLDLSDPDHPDLPFAKELMMMTLPKSIASAKEEGDWNMWDTYIRRAACSFFADNMHHQHIFDYIISLPHAIIPMARLHWNFPITTRAMPCIFTINLAKKQTSNFQTAI